MNSVFSKTLLWFIGTAIATMTAIVVLAALTNDDDMSRRPMMRSLLRVELLRSRGMYALYGPEGLAETLTQLRQFLNADGVVMTDRYGRDLVTGLDRPDLLHAVEDGAAFHVFPIPRTMIMYEDPATGMRLFLQLPRRVWFQWFFEPLHLLAVLALIGLLCYAFARNLTGPVQKLQAAVEGFGRGELDQRVELNRSDELGQLGATFNQMAERIQTLLAAERRLLGDISHELRSPLARLSIAVELARTSEDPGPQLDRIQKEADRLNALVGELLQVTRAEGDPSKMLTDPVPLGTLAEDAGRGRARRGAGEGLWHCLPSRAARHRPRRRGAAAARGGERHPQRHPLRANRIERGGQRGRPDRDRQGPWPGRSGGIARSHLRRLLPG